MHVADSESCGAKLADNMATLGASKGGSAADDDGLGYHVRGAVSIPGSYAGLLRPFGHLVASLCHIFT